MEAYNLVGWILAGTSASAFLVGAAFLSGPTRNKISQSTTKIAWWVVMFLMFAMIIEFMALVVCSLGKLLEKFA